MVAPVSVFSSLCLTGQGKSSGNVSLKGAETAAP